MQQKGSYDQQLIPHLFRTEYAKLTAVLCRLFGLQHMEIAEDIASDTFLSATEIWSIKGVPANPAAWLYTVAKNKTKDYLKRNSHFEHQVKKVIAGSQGTVEIDIDFSPQYIFDSQLEMMFAVCNPVIAAEAQVSLALQVLCGFSILEIANAFLSNKETIKKRLLRAREKLRQHHPLINLLNAAIIKERLDTVTTTLYLLFNEGYFSQTSSSIIKKDVCSEAVRLTYLLTQNEHSNTPAVNALLALMCFQSSRLEARTGSNGEAILFEEQNRKHWDRSLIEQGNYFLSRSATGNTVTRYHLEAGIAYWHTTAIDDARKWNAILQSYNHLLLIEYSPMAALNRAFAFYKVYGKEAAITEAEKLQMDSNFFYHSLLGELYTTIDTNKALMHLQAAVNLTGSATDKQVLQKRMAALV